MRRLILGIAALGALTACSGSPERSASVVNQADRPLLVAPPDTSNKLAPDISSRGTQPVSPVEQQARAEPTPKARPTPRPHKRAAVRPKPSVDTASVRGYAPATNSDTATSSDTSVVRDTASAPPLDTARTATPDTATPVPSMDTVAMDTVATARTDSIPADSTRPSSDSALASSATDLSDASQRTLPIGTEIHAALDDSISSRTDSAGRSITAQISQSVTGQGGRVLIPAGSMVRLTVTRLASAKSKSSQGSLALRVDGIQVGGQLQNVQAEVRAVPRELRGRGVSSGDAAKVGVGAVGGAVLGRVLGGNTKGAVVGGVVGAAGGAVVASQTATRDVVVKAKTPVTFVLTAPLVTP
jgi:hypothetical protein